MNAHDLFDTAPLGSLVSFTNDQPRPPERFRRKLAAWRTWNGSGRLVAIYPRRLLGSSFQSAGFVLKIGEYGSEGVTILTVSRHFELTCPLDFAILERPRPGMVRVLTEWNGKVELQHLAEDLPSAHEWLARHRYSNPFLSIVEADERGGLGAMRRAA